MAPMQSLEEFRDALELQTIDPRTLPGDPARGMLISRWSTPLVCVSWNRLLPMPPFYREVLPVTCRIIDGQVNRGDGVIVEEPPLPRVTPSPGDDGATRRRQREAYLAELRRLGKLIRRLRPRTPRTPRPPRPPRGRRPPRPPRPPRKPRPPRPPRTPRPPRVPKTAGLDSDIYCVYVIDANGVIHPQPTIAYPRGTIPPPLLSGVGTRAFRVPLTAGGCLGLQCTGVLSQYIEKMLRGLPKEWRVTTEELIESSRRREIEFALGRQRRKRPLAIAPPVDISRERARPVGWEGATVWSPTDATARAVAGGNFLVGLLSGSDRPPGPGGWIQMSGTFAVHVTVWM